MLYYTKQGVGSWGTITLLYPTKTTQLYFNLLIMARHYYLVIKHHYAVVKHHYLLIKHRYVIIKHHYVIF